MALNFIYCPYVASYRWFLHNPLIISLCYPPYSIYLFSLSFLHVCVDMNFPRSELIPIKHLPLQTARKWRPYSSRQYLWEKPNFCCLVSVAIHNSLFETSSFILFAVCIPLHLLILLFLINATKHGGYCRFRRNPPWYSLLFLTLLSIQSPLTYAIYGTNHVLVRDKIQLNTLKQKNYIQFVISNIIVNFPHLKTIRDTRSSIVQYSTPVIKHLNNEPFCFISDSNSKWYIIDTGANRVVLND